MGQTAEEHEQTETTHLGRDAPHAVDGDGQDAGDLGLQHGGQRGASRGQIPRATGGGAGDVRASDVCLSRQLHFRDELEQKKTSRLREMWIGGGGNDAEGRCLALAVNLCRGSLAR